MAQNDPNFRPQNPQYAYRQQHMPGSAEMYVPPQYPQKYPQMHNPGQAPATTHMYQPLPQQQHPQIPPYSEVRLKYSGPQQTPGNLQSSLFFFDKKYHNQMRNLQTEVETLKQTIQTLEKENRLLSNRIEVVESNLQPQSKWNNTHMSDLTKEIADLDNVAISYPPILNTLVDKIKRIKAVLDRIFYPTSRLTSTAPSTLRQSHTHAAPSQTPSYPDQRPSLNPAYQPSQAYQPHN